MGASTSAEKGTRMAGEERRAPAEPTVEGGEIDVDTG
jgi:hypothetical protein